MPILSISFGVIVMRSVIGTLCTLFVLFIVGGAARTHAQSSSLLTLDTPVTAAVTTADAAPSFFFDATAGQSLTVLITLPADAPDLVPLALIAQVDDNAVIGTITGVPGLTRAFAIVTPRSTGQHFVQVQGMDGTTGAFTLTVATTDAVLTPTAAPPTVTPTPAPLIVALGEEPVTGNTADGAGLYALPMGADAFIVTVTAETAPVRVVLADAAGRVLAALDAPLLGGAFFIPAGVDGLRLTIEPGAAPTGYTVRTLPGLDLTDAAPATAQDAPVTVVPLATNTPSTDLPTATPPAPPTMPASAADADLLITWGDTALVVTNISGAFVDLHALTLLGGSPVEGGRRRAEANVWARTETVNIFAVPPASCLGLRPLAFPDAPPPPAACDDLAAWWSSDALAVWLQTASFEVLYDGAVIQTCTITMGQCTVDLPDA